MGNEQQGGTSHHFVHQTPSDEQKQTTKTRPSVAWTKNGRLPVSKQTKPSWQLVRDVSMDMLSRKTTKLNVKQGPTPNLVHQSRSVLKKYPLQQIPVPGKPLPVYRVPRMPTEKEVAEIAIAYQVLCDYCDGPCIGDYARCRICIKTYHSQCLYERGHVGDQSFSLPRLGKQDWSCPDCADLTRLLTHDELNYLIYIFEQIDRNKDGYISMEDFLEYFSTKKITDNFNLFTKTDQKSHRRHYNFMDRTGQGAVAWSDFALFYSSKLISAKNKTQLTTKLSQKELAFAKNLFLKDPRAKIDNDGSIIINRDHFDRVLYDLTLTIKKKYGGPFIDAVLHENITIDETIERLSVFGWDDFLRQISVAVILNRSNCEIPLSQQPRRATIPAHLLRTTVISHLSFASNSLDIPSTSLATTPTLTMANGAFYDESFRKHGKILEKLNQKETKNKQLRSSLDWSIVEEDDGNSLETPKIKSNAKDQRQSISEPWSVVKDMQQLRKDPIIISPTRVQMLKV